MIHHGRNRNPRSKLNTFPVAVVVFAFYSAMQISGGFCKVIGINDPIILKLNNNASDSKSPQSVSGNGNQIRAIPSHIRVLRSPGSPEAQQDIQRYPTHSLFPPATTLMKKYAKNSGRMSRFHGGPSATMMNPNTGFNSPVAKMLVTRENPSGQEGEGQDQQGLGELEEQDPTFTPYIGARALSNIPNFFDEIRANLHALQMDEDEQSLDDMDLQNDEEPYGFGSKVDTMSSPLRDILEAERAYPEQKGLRWIPPSFGARTRGSNMRHFVQHPSHHNLNPASRNAYEFGLG